MTRIPVLAKLVETWCTWRIPQPRVRLQYLPPAACPSLKLIESEGLPREILPVAPWCCTRCSLIALN